MTPRRHPMTATLALVLVWPLLADAQRSFTVRNLCPFTIWPAIFTDPGRNTEYPAIAAGWQADANTEVTFQVPARWRSGRIWGRRNCDFSKPGEGPLQCATGGCIGGLLCTAPGVPPATLAEWTLGDPESGNDFYDVSLVDGNYNLPMSITTNVSCPVANCAVDLGPICPEVLRGPFDATGFALGCKTSCFANLDGHPDDSPNCCSGSFNKPETCPVQGIQFYSFFKGHCPNAYAYAYDESSGTALWTCPVNTAASYTLTFCPPGTGPSTTPSGTQSAPSATPTISSPTISSPPASGTQASQTATTTRYEPPPTPWTSYPPFSNPTEPEDGVNKRSPMAAVSVGLLLALVRLVG